MNVVCVFLRVERLELIVQDHSFGRSVVLEETVFI